MRGEEKEKGRRGWYRIGGGRRKLSREGPYRGQWRGAETIKKTRQFATKADVEPAPEGQGLEFSHDFLLSVPAGGIDTAQSPVSCI